MHALSLDFNQLERILSKAPIQLAAFIRQQLKLDPASPRTIDFEGEVDFGVRARLGQPQQGQYERFIPLVAQEILRSGPARVWG
jgi:hypothetical protein